MDKKNVQNQDFQNSLGKKNQTFLGGFLGILFCEHNDVNFISLKNGPYHKLFFEKIESLKKSLEFFEDILYDGNFRK